MTLRSRLLKRIEAEGPLTFASFMEAALYDAQEGFFSRAPVGREFSTSAHISPVFGMALARQILETGLRGVVDLGAGDGTLSRQLRAGLPGVRVECVERSAAAREALADAGFHTFATLAEVEPIVGCVVANELFDNVPFHLLRRRGGVVHEVFIDAKRDRFVEVEGAPTVAIPTMAEGEERPVSPQASGLVVRLAEVLREGYAFIFDYGFVAGEVPEPVRGYRGHRSIADLLAEPGAADITGPVDFDALAVAARSAGALTWGPITQRGALAALGYREIVDSLRSQQAADEASGDWRSAVAAFSARGEASMLVDPAGLGALKVLAIGTEGMPEPRIVRPVD